MKQAINDTCPRSARERALKRLPSLLEECLQGGSPDPFILMVKVVDALDPWDSSPEIKMARRIARWAREAYKLPRVSMAKRRHIHRARAEHQCERCRHESDA
jgi:hypothetical protein